MDIISFNEASTANGRIESFIENPDSSSGVVTVPKVITSGENITIPAGRVAVLPNVQVDGTLNIEGEVFIPSGATFGDLENQIYTKVAKVTSTDNAIVRFNGTTGDVQNSNVIIDDNNTLFSGVVYSGGTSRGNGSIGVKRSSDNLTVGSFTADDTNSKLSIATAYSNITFSDYSGDRLSIVGGNVGIGVPPSAWGSNYKVLQIGGMGIANRDAGNETFISNNSYHNGTNDIYKSTSYSNKYTQQYGQHQWFTAPSGTAGNAITWTNAMTLGSNGNLLVGTTTDNGSKLQVSNGNGSLSVSPHRYGVDIASAGNLAPHYITEFTVYKGVPGSGISKLRIAPGADNLLVGTSTDNGVDKLQVNGSISSGLVRAVSDLNNITNAGGFLTGDFTFSLAANSPCGYGTLHQIARSPAECTQMVQDIVSNRLFVRSYVGSAWTAWVEK